MILRNLYRRAFDLYVAVVEATGVQRKWVRWPASPTPEDLNRTPVVVRELEGQWVAYCDLGSDLVNPWSEFDAMVRSRTSVALAACKNMRDLSRESGVQYSTLWRAKDGRAIPESVIDLMGKVPHVTLLGPHGPIEDKDVVLTRDEAARLLRDPVTPEAWFRGAA